MTGSHTMPRHMALAFDETEIPEFHEALKGKA